MKTLRQTLLMACMVFALAASAVQPNDPIITSIRNSYSQAKETIKSGKRQGNEMVTTLNYTVRNEGKTTETLHFFYKTVQGTYLMDDDGDPHFYYYPLYFITRTYNIGKKKYYEEYLFDSDNERLIFAFTQDYDENGKKFDRRYYFHNGEIYDVLGPAATPFMQERVMYQANELKHAFDWIIQNPKE